MNDDRELLEKAAKAAGIELRWLDTYSPDFRSRQTLAYIPDAEPRNKRLTDCKLWSPLTDDGDALRLAVKLRLDIMHNEPQDNDAWVMVQTVDVVEDVDGEAYRAAATRRAIVRAAAAIDQGRDGRVG